MKRPKDMSFEELKALPLAPLRWEAVLPLSRWDDDDLCSAELGEIQYIFGQLEDGRFCRMPYMR